MTKLLTVSGRVFDLNSFTEDDIDISDIAHSLSLRPRFNGHTIRFYSVAEHSLFCAERMPAGSTPQERLTALLHDAPEAYLGDVIGPIKALMPSVFHQIETRLHEVISNKFRILHPIPDIVHRVDHFARAVEAAHLMTPEYFTLEGGSQRAYLIISLPHRHQRAKEDFLSYFHELSNLF